MQPTETRDYTLEAFEPSDFKVGQNYWCTGKLDGIAQEVKVITPDPMKWKVGEKYYGYVSQETSKSGKQYLRFHREQRPDSGQQSFGGRYTGNKPAYQPKDEAAIKGMWAIGQAVELLKGSTKTPNEAAIHLWATKFFEMVDEVKQGNKPPVPDPVATYQNVIQSEGYTDSDIPPEFR